MSEDRRDDRPDDDVAEGEGFLSRWSQRKAMAREGIELPDEPEVTEQPPGVADDEPSPPADQPAAASAEPTELPPLDSLTEDSDYSAFLASDVPTDLRQKALRKLFRSPKFNVRDGLDDYDLDFSNPEPLGDIVTAEMRHRIKVELDRLARRELEGDVTDESVAAVDSDGDTEREATGTDEDIAEDDNDDQPLTA